MEKYGIENLKIVVLFAVVITKKLISDFEDGKFTIWEGIGLLPEIKKIPALIKSLPQLKLEVSDLGVAEILELHEYIKANVPLSEDSEIEHIVENAIEWLTMTYNFYILIAKTNE